MDEANWHPSVRRVKQKSLEDIVRDSKKRTKIDDPSAPPSPFPSYGVEVPPERMMEIYEQAQAILRTEEVANAVHGLFEETMKTALPSPDPNKATAHVETSIWGVHVWIPSESVDKLKYLDFAAVGAGIITLIGWTGPTALLVAAIFAAFAVMLFWVNMANDASEGRGIYLNWIWPQIALFVGTWGTFPAAALPVITAA